MKAKIENGKLILELEISDTETLRKLLSATPNLFNEIPTVTGDPYKNLTGPSVQILRDLKHRFGNQWFSIDDPFVIERSKFHFVRRLNQLFYGREKLGFIEIEKNQNGHLSQIRFKF
jgi:hypothetical protein